MAFNPPSGVADGATYGYGNIIWEYDAIFGVWNIVDGTIVGSVGPEGPQGPAVPAGPAGAGNIPLASYAVTGAAQFFIADFGVSVTGSVSLTGNVARTNRSNTFSAVGGNAFTYGISAGSISTANIYPSPGPVISATGAFVSFGQNGEGNDFGGGFEVFSDRVRLGDFDDEEEILGPLNGAYIDIDNHFTPYTENPSYITLKVGNGGVVLDPTTMTIGSGYTYPMSVIGGVFKNPEEYASYQDLGSSNSIVINATGGTIQRFRITPSGQVTVSAGPGWDNTTDNATETIAVIVQSTNGKTGNFASTILSNNPVLFGVTGGIDMFTVMRVNTASSELLIGLPIANGLTGSGFSIS